MGESLATHVALIRGINVGGNNIVPMARLREVLDAQGLGPTRTYIQSGNVLVTAADKTADEVADAVSGALAEHFDVTTPVVAVACEALVAAVEQAPEGFGVDKAVYLDDVVFLRPTLSVDRALEVVRTREGVDRAWPGPGVLYFRRDAAAAGKSYLSKVVGTPEYKHMTIRNWRTTTTLAAMAAEPGA